jgi:hypothetical protein
MRKKNHSQTSCNVNHWQQRTLIFTLWSGRSVKLLLVFASTVIPGFSLLEIHDQDYFYSLLDMYVFRNGASSSTKGGSIFLCRRSHFEARKSVRTSQETHSISITKPNLFMFLTEIISAYWENHTEHINILYEQNRVFNVKGGGT